MKPYYFYTETAFHHEGDLAFMKRLIDASARIGADGVKFQVLIDHDDLISTRNHLYDKISSSIFSLEEWKEIFRYTKDRGLEIIMMPLDPDCFKVLDDIEINYFDLHSVSFYDERMIEGIKSFPYPLILGIGGRTLDEIIDKMNLFGDQLAVLMVGFQSFPTDLSDVGLRKIQKLKSLFPNFKIGYADHSSFDSELAVKSNEYAFLLGATYFEKHITVTPGQERLDFQSALSEEGCKTTIGNLDYIQSIIFKQPDNELFTLGEREQVYRNRQKVAVATQDLEKGSILSGRDITFKMLERKDLIGIHDVNKLIGKTLIASIVKDEAFTSGHLA